MSEKLEIPAGSPVNINLSAAPAAPVESESKSAKREAQLSEAKTQGANEVLKGLGVKKAERARMIEEIRGGRMKLAEAKQEAEEAKAQVAAKAAEVDAFKPYKDQVDQLTGALKKYADAEFAALPEAFQKVIVDMKLDEPNKRLEMIEILKRNGAVAATAAPTPTPAPAVKPSNTMAQTPAEIKTPAGPAANHYEQWKQLSESNQHYLAAQYFNAHQIKILEQRPKAKA